MFQNDSTSMIENSILPPAGTRLHIFTICEKCATLYGPFITTSQRGGGGGQRFYQPCLSVTMPRGVSHVTITDDGLDLTVQGPPSGPSPGPPGPP